MWISMKKNIVSTVAFVLLFLKYNIKQTVVCVKMSVFNQANTIQDKHLYRYRYVDPCFLYSLLDIEGFFLLNKYGKMVWTTCVLPSLCSYKYWLCMTFSMVLLNHHLTSNQPFNMSSLNLLVYGLWYPMRLSKPNFVKRLYNWCK